MQLLLQRQLSVAIENQPGRLASVSRLLADRGINIEALCVIDNVDQGMVRMVTNDPAAARMALEHAGFPVVEAEVLTLELTDRLGKLASIAEALATAKINIEYAYCATSPDAKRGLLILRPSNPQKALKVLNT